MSEVSGRKLKLKLRHWLLLAGLLLMTFSPAAWAATGIFAYGTLVFGAALFLISLAVIITPSDSKST